MSQWTHITGAIRFDLHGVTKNRKQDEELIESVEWILEDRALDNIPSGSEGSIKIGVKVDYIVERKRNSTLVEEASAVVTISGDLRDFQPVDFGIIEAWFKRLTDDEYYVDLVDNTYLSVRQGALVIKSGKEIKMLNGGKI